MTPEEQQRSIHVLTNVRETLRGHIDEALGLTIEFLRHNDETAARNALDIAQNMLAQVSDKVTRALLGTPQE